MALDITFTFVFTSGTNYGWGLPDKGIFTNVLSAYHIIL